MSQAMQISFTALQKTEGQGALIPPNGRYVVVSKTVPACSAATGVGPAQPGINCISGDQGVILDFMAPLESKWTWGMIGAGAAGGLLLGILLGRWTKRCRA